MHGLEQSEALTRAAQKLSAARMRYRELTEAGSGERVLSRATDALESAQMAYRAAYLAYTNPFGVVKTFS